MVVSSKVQELLTKTRVRLLGHIGRLPDFIIIGAQKCGTTSLILNLAKHPQIFVPEFSSQGSSYEVEFFNKYWNREIYWYKSLFVTRRKVCGEKTPEYILKQEWMERIWKTVPDVKLIICIRNPVSRFFSQFNMRKSRNPHLTFEEVFRDAEYIRRGLYWDLAKENVFPFFSLNKLLILISDDIDLNTPLYDGQLIGKAKYGLNYGEQHIDESDCSIKNLQAVCRFLGVSSFRGKVERHYVTRYNPEKLGITAEQIDRVTDYYHEANEKLFKFIGRRVPSWNPPYNTFVSN